MSSEPTLNEVLAHYGLRTQSRPLSGRKTVLGRDGSVLVDGTAAAVWEWLRENEALPMQQVDYDRRDACQHCREQREPAGLPERFAYERYSFSCYAGRYCDECWPKSGYRDATDPTAEFDPTYAGERMDD